MNRKDALEYFECNFKCLNPFGAKMNYGGVYAILGVGTLTNQFIYIGSTINFRNRLSAHAIYDPSIHSVWVMRLGNRLVAEREEIEYELIRAIRPTKNKMINGPYRDAYDRKKDYFISAWYYKSLRKEAGE